MLTDTDRAFFMRNGYVQLCGALSPEVCDHLVKLSWSQLPDDWQVDRSETWSGDVTDSCHTAGLDYRRGYVKYQKGAFAADADVQTTFGPRSSISKAITELLGPVKVRYRGLYMVVPFSEVDTVPHFYRPRVEAHPVQIVTTAYLAEVGPDAGGLLV